MCTAAMTLSLAVGKSKNWVWPCNARVIWSAKIVKCFAAGEDTATASLENEFTRCNAYVYSSYDVIACCWKIKEQSLTMQRARHMKRKNRKMLCSWRRYSRRVARKRIYEMQRTCVEQFGRECLLSENRRTALYHAMRASCEARKS